jgi:hypothetical protein
VTSARWISHLTATTVAMLVLSLAMVLTPWVSDGLFGWMIFREVGPPPGASDEAADYVRFSHGVLGAVMVGWFLLVLWLVRGPLARGAPDAWRGLVVSLAGWYAIDTPYSLIEGYWENAVLNTAILAAYAPALRATRPAGSRRAGRRPGRVDASRTGEPAPR